MHYYVLEEKSSEMKEFDKSEWKNYDIEHFGREIEWDTKKYFIKAEKNDEVVGTLELVVEGGVGKIHTLLVGKNEHGKGIGRSLIQKAEEITKKQNGHKLYLTTGKEWEAVKFYKAVGFEITGELKNHYFNIDFVELTKFLK
jgi:ribosomal protein S18 acetylase RimI-like enzyme